MPVSLCHSGERQPGWPVCCSVNAWAAADRPPAGWASGGTRPVRADQRAGRFFSLSFRGQSGPGSPLRLAVGSLFAATAICLKNFALHSLRHTMLTRLGESGVDAFTIMRIAGHSSIVVSQRYIHPTPEAVERAFERLQLSGANAENEPKRLPPATVSATLTGTAAVSH